MRPYPERILAHPSSEISALPKVAYVPLKPLPGWLATEKFPLPRELADREGE
jgi:hypothetical protein